MCWNPDISINTFIFACLTLVFIYITNTFTKYKTPLFNNPLYYLLFLAIASMQLVEYFLWKNLKNKKRNIFLSKFAPFVIMLQQIIIMLIIPNTTIRYTLLVTYAIFLILYKLYSPIVNAYTTVGKNGHLKWEWADFKGLGLPWLVAWLFFYIVPVLCIQNLLFTVCILPILFISMYYFYKYKTYTTIRCWAINLCLLFFIVNILLIQPYQEYKNLC